MALLAGSALAGDRVVTRSSVIPLSGSLYDSNTASNVSFTGWVHLVTTVQFPTDPIQPIVIDTHVNLPAMDVLAVNQDYANLSYLAHGAANATVLWTDPNQAAVIDLPSGFVLRLLPPNPITPKLPPNPIRYGLRVTLVNPLESDSFNSAVVLAP